jgi:hypothetical protein
MKRALATILAIFALTSGGCSTVNEPHQQPDLESELAVKGSFLDEAARLDPVVEEMADAVSAVVPGLTWRRVREGMTMPCEAVPGDPTSATAYKLPNVAFDGIIPDELWVTALERVQAIAAGVGATQLVVRVDEPGHHDVKLLAEDKTEFGLGTREAAALFSQTGCFLNPSDEQTPGS